MSFCNGVVIEIGRKLRAPADEEAGVQTYTLLWGRTLAVGAWWLALAGTAAAAILAAGAIRFRGPVVAQLVDAFAQDWGFTTGEALEGGAWFPALDPEGEVLARVITSGPDGDLEKIRSVLLEACACAQDSIKIMTPYFLSRIHQTA